MSPARLGAVVEGLPPIDLDELVARASLQTRVDRKYVLPVDAVAALLSRLPSGTRVLEIDGDRDFAYRSLYFDTPELTGYLMAARRRRRRFKIRTRVYEQSGECLLEVKVRGNRGSTVKERLPHDPRDRETLESGRHFVDAVLAENHIVGIRRFTLVPTLTTRYRRTTLHLPDTGSRVTIDTDLTWEDGDRRLQLPGTVVVETKTGSTASHADRLLWRDGHRPVRISKYATGLAALRPHLPDGPWRRTLRRYFPPEAVRLSSIAGARAADVPDGGARAVRPPERGRFDSVMSH